MGISFAFVSVVSLVSIALCSWRARRERRPVKVFDDIVNSLAMPLVLLPLAVTLPWAAATLSLAAGGVICLCQLWFVVCTDIRARRERGPG
jgi:O-antigen/teichoic acid export membrane protein